MDALKRFWRWLMASEYVTQAELDLARAVAYHTGLAQGELIGRQRLGQELEQMFTENHPFTKDEAIKTKLRQLH